MMPPSRLQYRFSGGNPGPCDLRLRACSCFAAAILLCMVTGPSLRAESPVRLPAQYFRLMVSGVAQVQEHMSQQPGADLPALEKEPQWRHLPYSILAPAVLYSKRNRATPYYHDPKMLAEAITLGDYLAGQNEKGIFTPRLDSDWDTYMWLE